MDSDLPASASWIRVPIDQEAIRQSQAHRPKRLGRNGPGLMVGFEKPASRLLLSGKKGNRPWSLRSNSLRPSSEVAL